VDGDNAGVLWQPLFSPPGSGGPACAGSPFGFLSSSSDTPCCLDWHLSVGSCGAPGESLAGRLPLPAPRRRPIHCLVRRCVAPAIRLPPPPSSPRKGVGTPTGPGRRTAVSRMYAMKGIAAWSGGLDRRRRCRGTLCGHRSRRRWLPITLPRLFRLADERFEGRGTRQREAQPHDPYGTRALTIRRATRAHQLIVWDTVAGVKLVAAENQRLVDLVIQHSGRPL